MSWYTGVWYADDDLKFLIQNHDYNIGQNCFILFDVNILMDDHEFDVEMQKYSRGYQEVFSEFNESDAIWDIHRFIHETLLDVLVELDILE